MTRKTRSTNRTSTNYQRESSRSSPEQLNPIRSSNRNAVQETHDNQEPVHETQPTNTQGSSVGKKRGRGKAKGDKGRGMAIEIYEGRIITTEAVRNIGVLFKQEIKGPWVHFSKYPKEELDVLFDRFKESGYTYTCSNEELKAAFTDHIKRNYADWMWNLRKPIFEKYKSTGERYANRPENVPDPTVWNAMIDEWLNPHWQDQSNSNKTNRGKSTIVHTTGSVSFAKYKKVELDQTGIEPSPIECFKKFHVSKGKEGEGENWRSEKAKEIYETMENKKSTAIEENLNVNDWDIYREVIVPSHGRVLGLGGGLKGKDLYSSSQSCNKRRCVELEENHQQLKDELKDVKGQLNTLQEQVQMLLNNTQNSEHARQSPYVDNVGSNGSDVNLSDDFEE